MAGDGFSGSHSRKGGDTQVRNYKVMIFLPKVSVIEAEDEADVLARVAEIYKRLYTIDFQDLIEPLPEPEDEQ
jgi:hypothetical protein